jgi:hypothetical protein
MTYKRVKCPDASIQAKIDALMQDQGLLRPEVKKMWVDALLSGKYKQGKSVLRRDNRFCCLGVLSDLYAEAHPAWQWKRNSDPVWSFRDTVTGDAWNALPPHAVAKWTGQDTRDATVIYKGSRQFLTALNDAGVPFEIIAGLIINQL